MEFVKKKVNMDILSPFITSSIKKVKHTQNISSAKTYKCMCVSECVYIFLIKVFKFQIFKTFKTKFMIKTEINNRHIITIVKT